MAYRMVSLPVTFTDLEGPFCCLKPFNIIYVQRALSTKCLHMNRKERVAFNFYYLFENERRFKVTASHVHCKCRNIVIESLLLMKTTDVIVHTTNRK